MELISVSAVLVFALILCMHEIPQMLKAKSNKELWAFSLLLVLGVSLAILRSFKVSIPNPSDWLAWLFSPMAGLLRKLLE